MVRRPAHSAGSRSRRTNAAGPYRLAAALKERGAGRLVHVSTDYVFDGRKGEPYDEDDTPSPIQTYGWSKLEGERHVLDVSPSNVVVRTAWLFGPGGKNFVSQIPAILRERGQLEALVDQRSSPTSAADLAPLLRELALRAKGGIYHAANAGAASYYEVAQEAARARGLSGGSVRMQTTDALPRKAARPRETPLVSKALAREGFAPLRPWQEALRDFVRAASGAGAGPAV